MCLVTIPVNSVQAITTAREDRQDRGTALDNFGVAGVSGAPEVAVELRECCVSVVDSELCERVASIGCCCA